MTPSPGQEIVAGALRTFLLSILESGWVVARALVNRVSEPREDNFVLMTPLRMERIETNVDTFTDLVFTGSISGTTMTVTALDPDFDAEIEPGQTVFGAGVAASTRVVSQSSGAPGGIGAYIVSQSQNLSARTLSAGTQQLTQAVKWAFQLDFHSKGPRVAGDAAVTFSTLFRDAYAVESFAAQVPETGVVPLYCEDPKQVTFTQDQQQYEERWVVETLLQANIVVSVPQQFADGATVEIVSVDAEYPPT
jgi:hypothetical protein